MKKKHKTCPAGYLTSSFVTAGLIFNLRTHNEISTNEENVSNEEEVREEEAGAEAETMGNLAANTLRQSFQSDRPIRGK